MAGWRPLHQGTLIAAGAPSTSQLQLLCWSLHAEACALQPLNLVLLPTEGLLGRWRWPHPQPLTRSLNAAATQTVVQTQLQSGRITNAAAQGHQDLGIEAQSPNHRMASATVSWLVN